MQKKEQGLKLLKLPQFTWQFKAFKKYDHKFTENNYRKSYPGIPNGGLTIPGITP
jgi:hypothetical protein